MESLSLIHILTFETGGAVTVVASNGVYDKEIPVQVYDEKSINRLDVEPSEIRLTPGGSVPVSYTHL